MPLFICEFHRASKPKLLNEEWFVVENTGDKPVSTLGCTVATGKGKGRLRQVGTLEPGFTLAPGEKRRVVTGSPAKKAQGKAPEESAELTNYYLFLPSPLLSSPGTAIALSLKQHELARATFDPDAERGVAPKGETPAPNKTQGTEKRTNV